MRTYHGSHQENLSQKPLNKSYVVRMVGDKRFSGIHGDVNTLCEERQLKKALGVVNLLVQQGTKISINTFASVLRICSRTDSFSEGKLVHNHIVKTGYESSTFIGNILIHMYANCGMLLDAQQVFNKMYEHNVVSWTTIIAAYVKHDQGLEALRLYQEMCQAGVVPDKVILFTVLKACASLKALEQGQGIHVYIIKNGFENDVMVGNSLIDIYGKCGSVEDAWQLFIGMHEQDSASWNALIAVHAQHSLYKEVSFLYRQMEQGGFSPNRSTFISILRACASLNDLERGKHVHAYVIKIGFSSDSFVASTLVYMYAKCGSIENASQVFHGLQMVSVVSWNAIIAGYGQEGLCKEALGFFEEMLQEGLNPDQFTFSSILKACTSQVLLEQGKQIHALLIKHRLEADIFVASALVDMYLKCGSIEDGHRVFSRIHTRDTVSWTTMIAGYSKQGWTEEAVELLVQMQQEGIKPDETTFISVLQACTTPAFMNRAKQIHAYSVRASLESNVLVGNALIDMYVKCGSIIDARGVFDGMRKRNVGSWTALISGYSHEGLAKEALQLYELMQNEGMKPDDVAFMSIIKVYADVADLDQGKKIHARTIKWGFEMHVCIQSSLVDMYASCGSIEHAWHVFSRMAKKDSIAYTAMIKGFAQLECSKAAFELFQEMLCEGVKPDEITCISILKACCSLTTLGQGKQIHELIIKSGMELGMSVGNTLAYMYLKCLSIKDAHQVFIKMGERDVLLWSTLIIGYAELDLAQEAFSMFKQMQMEAVLPNHCTYIGILKACSSTAALEQGMRIHAQIVEYGSQLDTSIGNSLVDMYANLGSIENAHKVFMSISVRDVVSWTVMIAAYGQQGFGYRALATFEEMQGEGLKPDEVTFVSVLSACSHSGLMDEGFNQFVALSQDHDIIPTTEHYACVVDLLGRAGRLEEAEDFISKMPIEPDGASWMALLGACKSHSNLELGRHAFEGFCKLERECAGAYVLLSNIFSEMRGD